MTDKTRITQNKKNDVNPIIVGVTGAVIGAGIALAGAAILKDEKNRDKAKKVLENIKNSAKGYIKDLENEVQKGAVKVKKLTAK